MMHQYQFGDVDAHGAMIALWPGVAGGRASGHHF